MYRIACTFEPQHPRIAGRITGPWGAVHVERRGVWRVRYCSLLPTKKSSIYAFAMLYMTSPRRLNVGTLVNPRRILAEFQAARRLAQAANRVDDVPVLTDVVTP